MFILGIFAYFLYVLYLFWQWNQPLSLLYMQLFPSILPQVLLLCLLLNCIYVIFMGMSRNFYRNLSAFYFAICFPFYGNDTFCGTRNHLHQCFFPSFWVPVSLKYVMGTHFCNQRKRVTKAYWFDKKIKRLRLRGRNSHLNFNNFEFD